jgi:hypothetical protein
MSALAIGLATPALAASSVLYATDNTNLYRVNTSTGASTLVGATGLAGIGNDGFGAVVRDLAASATTLYAANNTFSATGTSGAISTLDANTGAILTTVGLTGLLETGANKGLVTIAYDNATNTLFGTTSRRLYTFDALTGAATYLGLLPELGVFGLGIGGPGNNLFAISDVLDAATNVRSVKLLTLDKTNASLLSSVALTNSCGCDIAFDPLNNSGFITSAFFDANGGFVNGGLDALNAAQNGTTFVGNFGGTLGHNGLTFFGVSNATVPEPATWAMMLTGFGFAGGAIRRRKARAVLA